MGRRRWAFVIAALGVAACTAPLAFAGSRDEALKAFLADEFRPKNLCFELEQPTKYIVRWLDLNGDQRPEAIVYVSGRGICGAGGCRLLVIEQTRSGFTVRAGPELSRPPFGMLKSSSKGWRDLTVYVAGGGITQPYRSVLKFDGRHYAETARMTPRLRRAASESFVLDERPGQRETLVYPPSTPPPAPINARGGTVTVTGAQVDIALPEPSTPCWTWNHLGGDAANLAYRTGTFRTAADGTKFHVWRFEAQGPVNASLEFVLVPDWRFIYRDPDKRAAAAKTYWAKVVAP